jgi:hypothetical protein
MSAPVEVFLWRDAQHVGVPADSDEAGHLEWVPLTRVPELAARGHLLASGTLVALLYVLASRQPTECPEPSCHAAHGHKILRRAAATHEHGVLQLID